MKLFVVGFISLVAVFPALADQNELQGLALQALKSPSGAAQGEINGPYADAIRAKIQRQDAKIFAEITTIKALKQADCKRLNVRIYTPGTLLPTTDGSNRMLDVSAQMNMCPNGRPPEVDETAPKSR